MLGYFVRHWWDRYGSTWPARGRGWQAWHGWGGDEGFAWARRVVWRLDRAEGKANSAEEHAAMHVGVETAVMEAGGRGHGGHRTVTMDAPVARALVSVARGAARNVQRGALEALTELGLVDALGRLTIDGADAARQLARRFGRRYGGGR